jgi:hypothetical protein
LDGGSAHRKAATYRHNNTKHNKAHTDIHALSGIRTPDLSVGAGEDGSCLTPRGHCERPTPIWNLRVLIKSCPS